MYIHITSHRVDFENLISKIKHRSRNTFDTGKQPCGPSQPSACLASAPLPSKHRNMEAEGAPQRTARARFHSADTQEG